MIDSVRFSSMLYELLSEYEYSDIRKWLLYNKDWTLNSLITEDNAAQLQADIDEAREDLGIDEDDEYEEVSFYCENSEGEGMVTFTKGDGDWEEDWSEWNSFDEEEDTTPNATSYMSYLTKADLKQYLRQDGFRNITEVR